MNDQSKYMEALHKYRAAKEAFNLARKELADAKLNYISARDRAKEKRRHDYWDKEREEMEALVESFRGKPLSPRVENALRSTAPGYLKYLDSLYLEGRGGEFPGLLKVRNLGRKGAAHVSAWLKDGNKLASLVE